MANRLTPLLLRYLLVAESLGQAQNDPGPEDVSWTHRLGRHDALEFALLFRGDLDRNGGGHRPRMMPHLPPYTIIFTGHYTSYRLAHPLSEPAMDKLRVDHP